MRRPFLIAYSVNVPTLVKPQEQSTARDISLGRATTACSAAHFGRGMNKGDGDLAADVNASCGQGGSIGRGVVRVDSAHPALIVRHGSTRANKVLSCRPYPCPRNG